MSDNPKISPTMMWLKQLTTSTFTGLSKSMDRIDFLKRNKKGIGLIVALWLVTLITGYVLMDATARKRVQTAILDGARSTERLADQSGTPLLEDEVLGLNRLVGEFARSRDVRYAAILNHQNRVVAHSIPERLNTDHAPLVGQMHVQTIGDVDIQRGRSEDGAEVVTFFKEITFSGVTIGSAVYAVDADTVFGARTRYRLYRVFFVFLVTALFCGAGYLMDVRRQKTIQQPISKPIPVSTDGSQIGPYRLRQQIAQGGMAALFLADYMREDGFKRTVAIKKVLPHLAENQEFINMFIREARLAALLQHPNIVQIFDFGKIANTYFIAMEYIDGLNLGEIMAHLQTGLPVKMAVHLTMQASLGLHYSHARKDDETGDPLGIVHRDISPQNILISRQGEVKISDFGISKANTEPSLTQAGVIKGKLAYLSPEQALGQVVDQQADIYALGLVLYEILSGTRLYNFDSDIEAIRSIPELDIRPLKQVREDVPDALNAIVMKCLEKDKARRYLDARALYDDLNEMKNNLQMTYDSSDLSNFMRTTFQR